MLVGARTDREAIIPTIDSGKAITAVRHPVGANGIPRSWRGGLVETLDLIEQGEKFFWRHHVFNTFSAGKIGSFLPSATLARICA
jgi:hypothetical protein